MYWISVQRQLLFWALIISMLGSSCVAHRELISLNGGDATPPKGLADTTIYIKATAAFEAYKVRPNDQLLIKINSFEGSTGDFINQKLSGSTESTRLQYDPSTIYFNSYSINDSGYIKLPVLEKVQVEGLTTFEIQELLDQKLEPYIRLASTDVKLGNRRVTLLGEVARPGVQYLYNEQNTLLEAIGFAGDFTPFGNRKKVKLIRQTETGVKSVYLNLNRSDFLSTPYYYVQPNDVIYVEPLKPKSFDVSASSVGIVISGISLGVLIANFFIK